MTPLQDAFNLIPHCLDQKIVTTTPNIGKCIVESITHWTNLLFILAGIIAFFYVIYGGVMMLSAFGNEQKYTEAKHTVTYALIGLFIAATASIIVAVIEFILKGGVLSF